MTTTPDFGYDFHGRPRFPGKNAGRLHNPGWQLLDADHPGNLERFVRCFTAMAMGHLEVGISQLLRGKLSASWLAQREALVAGSPSGGTIRADRLEYQLEFGSIFMNNQGT